MTDDRAPIAVLTSGGDAPGMNAAVRAVVRSAAARGLPAIAVHDGYEGLMAGNFSPCGPRDVSNIIQRGGTVLGTSRSEEFRRPEGRARAAQALAGASTQGLVVIGGNGSFRGADLLSREHGIRVAGVPATIDHDIGGTEASIGFDTAVNTALEAIDRLRDTAFSLDRVFFVEVMGRQSGALAVATALAGGAEEVLVPGRPDELPRLVRHVRTALSEGKKSLIVVVAEGDELGGAEGVAAAVQREVPIRSRVSVLGYIQRGGRPSALDRILASRYGAAAVTHLADGGDTAMVALRGGRVVPVELSLAWTDPHPADEELLQLCAVLAQ